MIDLEALPIDVTEHIIKFRDFLVASWPCVDLLMAEHDWDEDVSFLDQWLQVNWEFLVERELLGKLGHLFPLRWNSHLVGSNNSELYSITCELHKGVELRDWIKKIKNYENEKLLLFGFRSKYESTFGMYPPFDYVEIRTLDKKKIYIVQIIDCRFILEKSS